MPANRIMPGKPETRREMLQQREQLAPAEAQLFSEEIVQKLLELKPLQDARVIMGYMSIRNEVDLWPLFEQLHQEDKMLLLPRIDGSEIHAIHFSDPAGLQKSRYGILEPVGPPFAPERIDAVLVPGVAFDYQGYRIGYGKGYYDRFLPRLRKDAFTCGVCYEFQVIVSAFPQAADCPVKWIVTERSELMIDERYF
mgnify:CR=1 FL=1